MDSQPRSWLSWAASCFGSLGLLGVAIGVAADAAFSPEPEECVSRAIRTFRWDHDSTDGLTATFSLDPTKLRSFKHVANARITIKVEEPVADKWYVRQVAAYYFDGSHRRSTTAGGPYFEGRDLSTDQTRLVLTMHNLKPALHDIEIRLHHINEEGASLEAARKAILEEGAISCQIQPL